MQYYSPSHSQRQRRKLPLSRKLYQSKCRNKNYHLKLLTHCVLTKHWGVFWSDIWCRIRKIGILISFSWWMPLRTWTSWTWIWSSHTPSTSNTSQRRGSGELSWSSRLKESSRSLRSSTPYFLKMFISLVTNDHFLFLLLHVLIPLVLVISAWFASV